MRARLYFTCWFGISVVAAGSYACNAILGLDELGTLAENLPDASFDAPSTADASPDATLNEAGPGPSPDIVDVQMGAFHGCALDSKGVVWCWGDNGFSQLGTTFGDARPRAEAIVGVPSFKQISAGMTHSCAVTSDGAVWCWGQNDDNQLGHDKSTDGICSGSSSCSTPRVVPNLVARSVLALFGTSCAVTMTNDVVCWGTNNSLLLGASTDAGTSILPVVVKGLEALAVPPLLSGAPWSGKLACASLTKDDVRCWGENLSESTGHARGTTGDQSSDPFANPTPRTVNGVGDVIGSVASWVSCATTNANAVYCWGGNSCGQLGQPLGIPLAGIPAGGIGGSDPSPTRVTNIPAADIVRVGDATCVRIVSDHSVTCWGDDTSGIVGASTTTACDSYDGVPGGFGTASPTNRPDVIARALSVGFRAAAVVDPSGHVRAWGKNPNAQLGHAKGTMGDDVDAGYRNPLPHYVDGLGP